MNIEDILLNGSAPTVSAISLIYIMKMRQEFSSMKKELMEKIDGLRTSLADIDKRATVADFKISSIQDEQKYLKKISEPVH